MKIAVTSQGTTLDDAVDPRFGRARYFLVVDTDDDSVEPISNEVNLNAAQGAGIQSAQAISGQGVKAVLTGHCGPKAFRALAAAGIQVHTGASGTIREALAAFKAGGMTAADSADVEGHWA
ncbi:MAG: NifB/NifX family molybdenum-iron cluster-binding protein [Phycisphaerae bacterium]|nr:NifB/NifX family molybdenum-iron cluster-binding protein [Phycisphaerae bacterium]